MVRLKVAEVEKRLRKLDGWEYKKKTISKKYVQKDFSSAMDFVNEIREHAERLGHYPKILIYAGNKVKIILKTAEEKGITDKDFLLAKLIDGLPLSEDTEEEPEPVQ